MTKLILAAFAAATFLAVQSPANAVPGGCDDWGCGMNGRYLNGIEIDGKSIQPTEQPTVNAVILPSGEIVDLR